MKTTFDLYLPATKTREAEFFKTIIIEVEERYGEQFVTPASSQKIERIKYKEMKRRGILKETHKIYFSRRYKFLKWLAYKGWGRVSDWALAESKGMLALAKFDDAMKERGEFISK